jgi:hypothetical protein
LSGFGSWVSSNGGSGAPDPAAGNFKVERLVLIVDSAEAQRLVATWPTAWMRYQGLLEEDASIDEWSYDFMSSWARLARCDIDDVEALIPVLFENELLLAEGVVAAEALQYVQARMRDALQKPPR